ncbi:hypothetical protein ScalyP_jg8936 [Parmales sp. scaly parma]|nr:hypothetical protein ScalyP_jg8936 [Parmales sp. scaly parma]
MDLRLRILILLTAVSALQTSTTPPPPNVNRRLFTISVLTVASSIRPPSLTPPVNSNNNLTFDPFKIQPANAAEEEGETSLFNLEIVAKDGSTLVSPGASNISAPSATASAPGPKKRTAPPRGTSTRSSTQARSPPKEKVEVDPYSKTEAARKRSRANSLWGGGGKDAEKRKKSQTFAEQKGFGAIVM